MEMILEKIKSENMNKNASIIKRISKIKGIKEKIKYLNRNDIDLFYFKKSIKILFLWFFLLILLVASFLFILNVGIDSTSYNTNNSSSISKDSTSNNINNFSSISKDSTAYNFGESPSINFEDDIVFGGVLNFFLNRKNSIIIYYLMISFLVIFAILIIYRLVYLWRCYKERYQIEKNIISNNINRISELDALIKNESEKKYLCKKYVSDLYRSFTIEKSKAYFSEFYKGYLEQEEQINYYFYETANKNIMWIIRIGILGTLLGIAIAFYQVHYAMKGLIPEGLLTDTFLVNVRAAMIGNAFAVVTSIAAHGATLIIEVGIFFSLRKENNIDWLSKTYIAFLNFKELSEEPKALKENITDLNIEIVKTKEYLIPFIEALDNLNKSSQIFNVYLKNIIAENENLIDFIRNCIKKELSNFNIRIIQLNENFNNLNKNAISVNIKIIEKLKKIKESTERLIELIIKKLKKYKQNL